MCTLKIHSRLDMQAWKEINTQNADDLSLLCTSWLRALVAGHCNSFSLPQMRTQVPPGSAVPKDTSGFCFHGIQNSKNSQKKGLSERGNATTVVFRILKQIPDCDVLRVVTCGDYVSVYFKFQQVDLHLIAHVFDLIPNQWLMGHVTRCDTCDVRMLVEEEAAKEGSIFL